jgi:hypothetical protein
MHALRQTNMGFDRLADLLNAEGLKPRTGARWWGRTVNNIVSAELCGNHEHGIRPALLVCQHLVT